MFTSLFMSVVSQVNAYTYIGTVDDFERDWTYKHGDWTWASGVDSAGYLFTKVDNDETREDVVASAGINSENIDCNGYYYDTTVKIVLNIYAFYCNKFSNGYLGCQVKLYRDGYPIGEDWRLAHPDFHGASSVNFYLEHITLTPYDNLDIDVVLYASAPWYFPADFSSTLYVDSLDIYA